MIRTQTLVLEEKIGEVLKVDTAALARLIGHCADILIKCQRGKDGRTPYERLRGKQLSGSLLEFRSQVMLKVMDKVSGGVIQERWVEGTWLANRFKTLEHMVARKSDGVVVRTRGVRDFEKSRSTCGVHHQSNAVKASIFRGTPTMQRDATWPDSWHRWPLCMPQTYGGCWRKMWGTSSKVEQANFHEDQFLA